jgi:FolB domain-containing protein
MTPSSPARVRRLRRWGGGVDTARMAADDRIHLTGLRVRGIVGIHPWEREKPQELVIHATLWRDLEAPARSDAIDDTLSYGALSRAIVAHVATAKPHLLEKLARDLARIAIELGAARARIRIDKPWAVEDALAAVELERSAADFSQENPKKTSF